MCAGPFALRVDCFVLNRVRSNKTGCSDRKAKLQDPQPVHQQLLPRVETRVKQLVTLVSIAGANTRTVLIIGISHLGCFLVETEVSTDEQRALHPV